ncbi:MAG: nicotinate-nucleotide adenylyltransferase [Proteobacteria bacterium]|nr:nicotinate-nucleotide adenylyltransferase [Pseudomonadota bacterium]MBU1420716.1 nicotinate-nucleotide adenylyltransferase [Pseudomonadota bacterium]MBU1455025.1 nicotinate-nucleotide adenylyltransferase [Pseudomonadota bacterium]
MDKAKVGVIHGRFQLLHNDHMKYLLAGKKRCDHLVVGITNPDPSHTRNDPADMSRSSMASNPLTYYERYCMVREALAEQGLHDSISIVPFPINFPDLYQHYVPLDALFFLTIYDAWGEKKLTLFQELGLNTEILWRKKQTEKGLSATDIRGKIINNEEWEQFVPPAVVLFVKKHHLAERFFALREVEAIDK